MELSVEGAEVTAGSGEIYVVAAGVRHAVRTGSRGHPGHRGNTRRVRAAQTADPGGPVRRIMPGRGTLV
ncbi:hypothetical protein [Streptomyces sp. NPDC001415]